MTQPEDEATRARQQAEEMEESIKYTEQDEHDTIGLMDKLDTLAAAYFEHAKAWEDAGDHERASNIRKQEKDVHDLRKKLARMAEMEIEEIKSMMDEVHRVLKSARRP